MATLYHISTEKCHPWLSESYNPYVRITFSHPYHLDESTLIFRGIKNDFSFLFHSSMKLLLANSIAPDEMPHSAAASHVGLYCLPVFPKIGHQAYMG